MKNRTERMTIKNFLFLVAFFANSIVANALFSDISAQEKSAIEKDQSKCDVLVTQSFLLDLIQKMGKGIFRVTSLNKSNSSNRCHHHITLSHKMIEKIKSSSLLIWCGVDSEKEMETLLKKINKNKNVINFSDFLQKLHTRFGTQRTFDSHWWLSPQHMKIALQKLKHKLIELYPKNKHEIESNFNDVADELDKFHEKLQEELKPYKNKPYVIYHDIFPYVDLIYGTKAIDGIVEDLDSPLKPSQLRKIELLEPKDRFILNGGNKKLILNKLKKSNVTVSQSITNKELKTTYKDLVLPTIKLLQF
jgi:ABC-type Zn uptake system ZnuABC Zn-binding protein ZnuA